jgi:hypothetical protein
MLLNDGTLVKAADADAPQESAPSAPPNRDRRRTGGGGQGNR